MVELLTIFITGFLSVFAMGFQSRNVNNGDYKYAALSSLFIGLSSVYLWNTVPATLVGGLIYGASGSCGITLSMWIHKRFIQKGKHVRD